MKFKFNKNHKKDSARWLRRHFNDEYFQKSKVDGFRSRSSYKLIQINEKFCFLNSRKKILDLGCSPGGWLQVTKKFCPTNSKIMGIDKLSMKSIPGVFFHKGDIFDEKVNDHIKTFFNSKIDLLMSDMSPNSTGNKKVDHLRIISLVEKVIDISDEILDSNGVLVLKIFQGGMQGELEKKIHKLFLSKQNFKPKASRPESPELYLIAKKK
tara:strand:+ start:8060 stop:8689 length:630 start_codon:yes stop_codon:yes gene_type:complete